MGLCLVVLVSVGMVSVLTGVTQSGSCCTPVVVCVEACGLFLGKPGNVIGEA